MKYVCKENVIRGLKDLSDYEFQKIAWFDNDLNLVTSLPESFAQTVDDTSLASALDSGEIVFDPETDKALIDLMDYVVAFDDFPYPEDVLIEMPEMYTIRAKAARCLELVLNSDGAGRTVTYRKPGERLKLNA